jgi:NAD(P)-dependent dehydrogenase (short-subunit alcohol dehydrogenase family)
MRFTDKVVLVAGGTGGLGQAVSLAFLDEGAKVIVSYRKDEEFNALQKVSGANRSLGGHSLDVTDQTAVDRLVEGIVREHGQLDVLVNAVGGYAGGVKFWDLERSVFDQMLALNLRAGYVLSRAAAKVMIPRRTGAIVNVAGKAGLDHAAGAAAYAASKAAAIAMIDSLAADLKGSGVRANSILPSIIDTAANRSAMPGAHFAAWPKPEDIARVILFLASDDAKVIHGAAIPAYGNT